MNGIARLMNLQGHQISGSDRENDRGHQRDFFRELTAAGITLFPQDGSGIHDQLDQVIISTAVESSIPDVLAAKRLELPIIHRSEILMELMASYRNIAVAGTSGKSTVTGLCAWALQQAGFSPTVINGARILDLISTGVDSDILLGKSPLSVFEADESDGSLVRFKPSIGILTNISKDHLPIDDLLSIFRQYIANIKDVLIANADCPLTRELSGETSRSITFGEHPSARFRMSDITTMGLQAACTVEGCRLQIAIPGVHNLQNAMAAYTLLRYLGKAPKDCISALETFRGIHRRFQITGQKNGVTVVDDFAHNPDKIRATMSVSRQLSNRVIYVYQPHGFGPTRFLFNELIDQFISGLRPHDRLILTPIFYAGGTTQQDVRSEDLAAQILAGGRKAQVLDRANIIDEISHSTETGDWVIVMGARDPSLSEFSRQILIMLH